MPNRALREVNHQDWNLMLLLLQFQPDLFLESIEKREISARRRRHIGNLAGISTGRRDTIPRHRRPRHGEIVRAGKPREIDHRMV